MRSQSLCVLALLVLSLLLVTAGCRFGGGDFYEDVDTGDVPEDDDDDDDDSGDDDTGDDDTGDDDTFETTPLWGAVSDYDPDTETMIVFGGALDQDGLETSNALWDIRQDGKGWEASLLESTGDVPPGLVLAAGAYAPSVGLLAVFGGYDELGIVHGNTWIADFSEYPVEWTEVLGIGPSPRFGAAAMAGDFEEVTGFVVFGGQLDENFHADTWALRLDTGVFQWVQVTPSTGQNPSPRAGAAMIHNPNTEPGQNRIWMTTGVGPPGLLGETWKFNPNPGEFSWAQFPEPCNGPSPRFGMMADTDTGNLRGVFFGGGGLGFENDLYVFNLDPADQFWRTVPLDDVPPGRRFGAFAWHEAADAFLLYGGIGATGVLDDLWMLPADTLDAWSSESF